MRKRERLMTLCTHGLLAAACLLASASPASAGDDFEQALATVRADEARRVEVFERAAKSVVCIFSDGKRAGGGSGVVVDPEGYGLTNFHVVQPFIEQRLGFGALSDGRMYSLKVLGVDPSGDIAMFKLEGKPRFDYAELGDSDALRIGQRVAAMGNPFVLAEDNQPTITLGVVSGLHRYQKGQGVLLEYADCIQVSSSINPGNSGGPLLDMDGRLVGINGRASFEERGRVNVGLGYAVSINQIKRFMPGLRAGGLMEHGTLGATVRMAGGELIVNAVQAFSPAEVAGIQLGDEILSVAGRTVRTPNDYNNVMTTLPADWPVNVRLLANGVEREVAARLERVPNKALQYLPDFQHNHVELAKILARTPSRLIGEATDSLARLTIAGRIESATGDDRRFSLTAALDGGDTRFDSALTPEDEALILEWLSVAAPLLAAPRLDSSWLLAGGDEVDGRIAYVVERQSGPGRRIRWKFDWRSLALLQVVIEAPDAGARVWMLNQPPRVEAVSSRAWTRMSANAADCVVALDSLDIIQSAEPPVPATQGGVE